MDEQTKFLAMLAALTGIALQRLEGTISQREYDALSLVNDICWNKETAHGKVAPTDFYIMIKQAEKITGFTEKK